MRWLRHQNERGVIIIGALMVTSFFLITSLAVAEFGINHFLSTRRTLIATNAINAADAGADAFLYQLSQNSAYQGTNNAPSTATNSCTGYTSSPVTLVSNSYQGKLTYDSCVTSGAISTEKFVYVTAKAYRRSTDASPVLTRKLRIVLEASTTGATYSIESGNGGLVISNNATLGAGDYYINGRLLMSNGSSIGDATGAKASHIWVAGNGCGSGASYPQICSGATGQADLPIYLANPAHIYADVHAPNETGGGTDGSSTRSMMTNSGLVDGNASVVAMPDDNRTTVMARNSSWINRSASSANCPSGQKTTTWAAGTHFTGGDVGIDQQCQVTVNGDIWIDGGLFTYNSSSLKVGSSVTVQPNIMIDGQNGFQPQSSSSMIASASNITFRVNTYWSAAGTCSTTCPVPTGTALQTSQNTNTIVTNNSFTAPGTTFYAVYSGINVSNGTNLGQLIGQKITLSNTGTITFSGGTITNANTVWNVGYYEEVY